MAKISKITPLGSSTTYDIAAWSLKQQGRLTDANITHETDGSMVHFKASSSMTANKPMGDGNILHFHWDGNASNSWDAQLYIPDSHSSSLQWRAHTNATTWGTGWHTVLDDQNYSTTCDTRYVKKAGDTMSGNLIVSKTGDTYVEAKNTTTGCRIEIDVNDAGKHGLWSSGYYANSTYTASSKWIYYRGTDGEAHSDVKIYGAVWNDYAEYRKDNPNEIQEPGRCIKELGDGSLALTTKRLERGCEIVSDTFGFAIGKDEDNGYNTPIASNGRVLAYPYESIEEFTTHIGWPVCSGPNGTVSIMTEEEEKKYPSRIIGTISEIPTYEEWGTGNVKVNGRIWIRIK